MDEGDEYYRITPHFPQGRSVEICRAKTEGAVCSFEDDLPHSTSRDPFAVSGRSKAVVHS
jgi:hypothetical protein